MGAGRTATGHIDLVADGREELGASVTNLTVSLQYMSKSVLRVSITNRNNTRWRIPSSILPGLYSQDNSTNATEALGRACCTRFHYEPFFFTVHRAASVACVGPGVEDADGFALNDAMHDARTKPGSPVERPASTTTSESRPNSASRGAPPSVKYTVWAPLFDLQRFAFKEHYLEVTTPVPEDSMLLGLGEQTRTSGALRGVNAPSALQPR